MTGDSVKIELISISIGHFNGVRPVNGFFFSTDVSVGIWYSELTTVRMVVLVHNTRVEIGGFVHRGHAPEDSFTWPCCTHVDSIDTGLQFVDMFNDRF